MGRFVEWLVVVVLVRLFPSRYRQLNRADGRPFFRQFKVWSFGRENPRGVPPWWHCSGILQSFLLPDDPGSYHIHRWRRMFSFGLSGRLVEDRGPAVGIITHLAPWFYTMGSDCIHQARGVAPRTWSLFIMLGANRNRPAGGWGYYRWSYLWGWGDYRRWDEVRSAEVKPL